MYANRVGSTSVPLITLGVGALAPERATNWPALVATRGRCFEGVGVMMELGRSIGRTPETHAWNART
jgi:hypothetical protein